MSRDSGLGDGCDLVISAQEQRGYFIALRHPF